MKELVRKSVSRVIVGGGVSAVGRRVMRWDGATILYGHRVADDNEGYLQGLKPEWLDEQLAYLTRHFEVIPLSTLVDCFEQGQPVPRRSAVLTFDDGFRDNLENAAPLLEKYRVPATVFLVTGSITTGDLPWSQRLGVLFQQTTNSEFAHPLAGDSVLGLSTPAERRRAYLTVKAPIARMGRIEREQCLAALARELRVDPPRDRMLNWDEARTLRDMGIELGAHTYSHPLLANVPIEEARWEMERSRNDLKEQLGIERPSFCFPAGSMNAALLDLVPRLGFRSAFVPNRRIRVNNLNSTHQFALSRVGMPEAPGYILEAELDGPLHLLRQRLGSPLKKLVRGKH